MPDPSAPPGTTPAGPTLEQLDEVLKPKSISESAENYRLLIEWRKLRNQAQNDPAIRAAFAAANRAPTDLQKRHLLGHYFKLLFDKEIALGPPEMKNYINDRRAEHLKSLPQPRVRPEGNGTPKGESKKNRRLKSDSLSFTSSPTPSPSPRLDGR